MRPISSEFLILKAMALFILWMMLSASFNWIHLGLGIVISFTVAWINAGHSPFVPKFRLWVEFASIFAGCFSKSFKVACMYQN